ncbi:hypothetical protein F610DRAFT_04679 [Streptomyces sp. LaPpAH-199]|nr:hypothetical protein F610DRAFT_04679 [Streptomyces sp. LaPpAH-199]
MPAPVKKQVHLAAQLPGIHNVTVWSDPRSESQIAIDSFIRLAQTVERGKSTSSSSPKGCGCASTRGRSTTWTSPAGRRT